MVMTSDRLIILDLYCVSKYTHHDPKFSPAHIRFLIVKDTLSTTYLEVL
jgi:hypothetical protein